MTTGVCGELGSSSPRTRNQVSCPRHVIHPSWAAILRGSTTTRLRDARRARRLVTALAPRDEHVLAALVVERLAGEAAVERLHVEARHVDEAEPLVLRCPPERGLRAVVKDDIDAVGADGVPKRVRDGILLVLYVQPRRDVMVEGERVPCEPSAGPQRRRDALERATAVPPRWEIQERAVRAVDQRRRLVELEVAHVALA